MECNKDVLIITPGFPADETDTACVPYLQDYVLELNRQKGNHALQVIAIHYPDKKEPYSWNGIQVYPAGGKNRKGWRRIITVTRLIKLIKNLSSETAVLHCFWMTDGPLAAQKAKGKNQFMITTLMGQDAQAANRFLKYMQFEKMKIVALSQNHEKTFYNSTKKHADYIIPFRMSSVGATNTARDIDLLFTGSFIPLKQPFVFIELVKNMKNDFRGIKCMMAGGGPLMEEIEKMIMKNGLAENITCTGQLRREEIFDLMKRSKVLIHPSLYEGQGYIYQEALAHGMYVISFDTGHQEVSPKHIVCRNSVEMQGEAKKIMRGHLIFEPFQELTSADSVQEYIRIYNAS